jgi:hypothetical protein
MTHTHSTDSAVHTMPARTERPVHQRMWRARAPTRSRSRRRPPNFLPALSTPLQLPHASPLHYGESDEPCKMTYSRMAFCGRPCCFRRCQQKCQRHMHAQRVLGGRAQAAAAATSAAAALVRALSVAPFLELDDEQEKDDARRKEAAGQVAGRPSCRRPFVEHCHVWLCSTASCSQHDPRTDS